MMKIVLVGLVAGCAAIGATASVVVPSRTSADVKVLATEESQVLATLRSYQPTATWKEKFEAAVAAQAAALRKLNEDLSAPTAPPITASAHPQPLPLTDFGLLAGTAKPVVPAGPAGKVAIVFTGPVTHYDDGSSDVAVIVRNNTSETIKGVRVTGPALNTAGEVVGSGESLFNYPAVLRPGAASLVDVYFDSQVIPDGSRFRFGITSGNPIFERVDFRLTQAREVPSQSDEVVVGEGVNPSSSTLSELNVGVACFSAAGKLRTIVEGDTSQQSVGPGGVASFSVDPKQKCPNFLVGVNGDSSSD